MQAYIATLENGPFGLFFEKSAVILRRLMASFQLHGLLFGAVAVYIVMVYAVQHQIGGHIDLDPLKVLVGKISLLIMPLMLIGLFFSRLFYMIFVVRPAHPLRWLGHDLGAFFFRPARLLNAIPATIAVIYFVECYTGFKDSISFLHPFAFDATFMQLDKSLHFGVDPWRILQPLLGYPVVTTFINFCYNMWFFVLWFVLVTLAFSDRNGALRMQYFFAFIISWMVGGSVMALGFSSAGPAFYSLINAGVDPYAPLMSYLQLANESGSVPALVTQKTLWDAYLNGNEGIVSGISAMPSMHNATAVLLALLGARVSRFWGIAGAVFAFIILIGSVHLGWHYAVDGYVGIVLALGIWFLAGHVVRWYFSLPLMQRNMKILADGEGL